MRLPEADLALIDRAANARGLSRTDFVREASVRAAEDVLMDQRLIRMSTDGFAHFIGNLASPAGSVSALVEVLHRPAPWELPSG